ncbi:HIT family protein [Afifella sp. IM 167]|uniref:HIT family protein n=1 Tax=Afifella sp. IM 167 TaxID=2033586 RepID=UPI001CCC1B5F|nr:HIT family protein [Afifella sp. IM 167]MBZ8133798.1 diadenosine tetraphosphate hydrolase [Afifella sp. IM 167]
MTHFDLDQRLESDSVPLAELSLCEVRIMRDATYPWLLMIPQRPGLSEIIDLSGEEQALMMREIDIVARALKTASGCDKLNIAALGNQVRQLHVHVIARFEGDAAWPGPVWGAAKPRPWEAGALSDLARKLLEAIGEAAPA